MHPILKKPSTWLPVVVALSFVAGMLVGGRVLSRRVVVGADDSDAFDKLSTIMAYIDREYVDEVDTDSLLEAVLPDLMEGLDPHSVYIPASDLRAVNDELEGSFSGIGISFQMMSDTITVLEVISGGPSEKVGLMPGDRIVTIDDTVAAGRSWSSEKVITHLRGPQGTKVRLGIRRPSAPKLLNFEITRGDIPVVSIDAQYMLSPQIGYVRVNKFARNTYKEFMDAVGLLQDEADLRGLVVDLRGNGGGYMEMATLMANEFLPEGAPIVSTLGRTPDTISSSAADGLGQLGDLQVVVLLDEYSASASEIFAGAIQDNDRGLVIGRRSFGKGLVQRQFELSDSSAIRLTTARYYTPSGRSIQKRYEHGATQAYQQDLIDRYDRGELFSADSIKLDKSITFYTSQGRPVYGGGGIMPDIFVPNDTTGVTSYYINVVNNGILQKFAFDYFDANRASLSRAKKADDVLRQLPADDDLLRRFADYAAARGVPQRWGYINISRDLIVNQLKAMIARNALGVDAYYEVYNVHDPAVTRALRALRAGEAAFPVKASKKP